MTLLLEECGEAVRVSAFESLLANMSHEMAKGKHIHVQWGFEIWTSLDFEWSKRVLVANGPDFEWDLKPRSPTI